MDTLQILVIDDEAGMRAGITRALARHTTTLPEHADPVRFEISGAGTGEEGLAMIEADPPDILLLDRKLPGISGLDVLRVLDERCPDLITVMITAYASLDAAVKATKRGAYDFLPKPFTPAELRATVDKAAAHLLVQRRARALEEERRQLRFQFTRVLAHELKAPLSAVQGYLFLLRDRALGEELPPYDTAVDRSLTRLDGMRKLITDLLDLTRIESGKKVRELATVDVNAVAARALETMAPDAEARGIEMVLHGSGAATLFADAGELEIVLNNLVSNAVKYNRDQGRVEVHVEAGEDGIRVAVSDTGVGMSAAERDRLFGEFVRLKNPKTRDVLGSGLGLSIVKKITALYNGEVHVESVPGEGSTFSVVLRHPVETEEADGVAAPDALAG